jgi:hypothetical protein
MRGTQAKNSRAPSYFSQYFGDQLRFAGNAGNVRTLYIDRDPETFRDIVLHLQGMCPARPQLVPVIAHQDC